MDNYHYLTSLSCIAFFKKDSNIFKELSLERKMIVDKMTGRNYVRGIFMDFSIISKLREEYIGSKNEFYFVAKIDLHDFNNNDNKNQYIKKVEYTDIISIEMIFDETEYGKISK